MFHGTERISVSGHMVVGNFHGLEGVVETEFDDGRADLEMVVVGAFDGEDSSVCLLGVECRRTITKYPAQS